MGALEKLRGHTKGLTAQMSQGGFNRPAHISIANNRFTLVDDLGNETPWQSLSIDVVIVDMSEFTIRTFYGGQKYDPNAPKEERVPVCSSQNGVTPDPQAQQPQANNCRACQWDRFGTDFSGRGGKGCTEYKRVAVLVVGAGDMAYLLTVGPGSHKSFRDYGAYLNTLPNRPEAYEVVTRIEFDPTPGLVGVLNFQPVAWVNQQQGLQERLEKVAETGAFDRVLEVPGGTTPALAAPAPAPAAALGVGQLPSFGGSPAPVAVRPTTTAPLTPPSHVQPSPVAQPQATDPQMAEFLAWKAAQGKTQAPPQAPTRKRRTKAEMEAPPQTVAAGRTAPPPQPPQGFQPPTGFQPSPSNPFASATTAPITPTEIQPPGMEEPQQGSLFGMQPEAPGLTDGMKNALNWFLGTHES